jgi:Adenylate and Guanylate cyclase catalytic domain
MAKFANDCRNKFNQLTHDVKEELDVGNLAMRFGLHSGPVVAGVLRGQRSRYQLFGDTVNTASRMETTGAPNRIHVSQETANQLRAAGKSHWIQARDMLIEAKGKGTMQTYWVDTNSGRSKSCSDCSDDLLEDDRQSTPNFDWITERLTTTVEKIVSGRKAANLLEQNQQCKDLPSCASSARLSAQVRSEIQMFVCVVAALHRGKLVLDVIAAVKMDELTHFSKNQTTLFTTLSALGKISCSCTTCFEV